MEEKTTTVRETNNVVDGQTARSETVSASSAAVSGSTLAARVVWFIAGVIMALLALRVLFQFLGANQGNAFVDFIYGLSYPFAYPFFGIFGYEPAYGVSRLEVSSLVAIAIYALIAWGLAKLLTLNRQ